MPKFGSGLHERCGDFGGRNARPGFTHDTCANGWWILPGLRSLELVFLAMSCKKNLQEEIMFGLEEAKGAPATIPQTPPGRSTCAGSLRLETVLAVASCALQSISTFHRECQTRAELQFALRTHWVERCKGWGRAWSWHACWTADGPVSVSGHQCALLPWRDLDGRGKTTSSRTWLGTLPGHHGR